MTTQKLHSHPRSKYRRNLRIILLLVDFISSFISLLILWPWAAAVSNEPTSILGLWLFSALLAWMLTRRARTAIPLEPYSQVFLAPALAVILNALLLALVNFPLNMGMLMLSASLWVLCMGLVRLSIRRHTPPLLVGLVPGAEGPLPNSVRVEYVTLTEAGPEAFENVEGLLLNPGTPQLNEWFDFLMHAHASGMPVWTPASLNEELTGQVSVDYLQTAHMSRAHYVTPYAILKRLLDLAAVIVFAVPLLILCGLVALTVLFDAGRPILFWQERVGQDERTFRIAKFRTMRRDSEHKGAAFAQSGDSRITRLGGILRKLRLDELPQFWNVLKGEMSIIGPRPEQVSFVHQFNNEVHLYPVRHWVKPGITGWAQVMQGYAADTASTMTKVRYDVYYIKHFSFWLDARIAALTVWTIITGFGAR